ncbi:S-adenosyl-L-methionine:benzoic acid/salicylic acid carboxyl methyltransferase 3 [Lactuca sativa]|uniref:Uncharacterized protein n=1 Tax=Lactuca sativa TaxID=4236 RepID=A0A9R1W2X7_LACSA|nr:S-adenosyl-L-methionine:benzoic acid/salicylic acid carboxyl methyltransferase 3 [Lactuca sativa]KAJ0216478.1 hypothetical protein LSAT_V11C300131070 [Lactuca sativa]
MEAVQLLHMKGGNGDASYSNNSLLQRKVISMTKPILKKATVDLYSAMNFPKTIVMADLGCSSGPNTLLVAATFIKMINEISLKMGHEPPEIQIHLNDLPGNDFNIVFLSLPKFLESLRKDVCHSNPSTPSCYFSGVAGSFYTRLFPSKSLHFVHSSYSLMWLSQVPELEETNKGNIYMSSTSPSSVIRAYYQQFQTDFSMFLKCRADEMVSGGRMVLTILGRRSDDPCSKECCYIWELLAMALNDMVYEGRIEESQMDSFNIPQYTPSPKEVKNEVEKEGSFLIDCLDVSEVTWDSSTNNNIIRLEECKESDIGGYNMAKCMRAVAEPLLVSHFGLSITKEVFLRYRKIIIKCMSKEETKLINVTVSMTTKS